MAEGNGVVDHLQPVDHVLRQSLARRRVADLEGDHAGHVRHLPLCEVPLRVAVEAGIDHAGDGVAALQPFGHSPRARLMRLHAKGQCGKAPVDEPGVEGRHDPAVVDGGLQPHPPDQFLGTGHRAAHRVAMPADIFGDGVHDEVDAKRR